MSFATAYGMKKRMAKGGEVKGVHAPMSETSGNSKAGQAAKSHANVHPYAHDKEMQDRKAGYKSEAKGEHERVLSEMKSMPKPNLYAHGGMVDRIMKKRCYSEGGMVANESDQAEADEMPAEFDDLALDDHLEGHEHADGPGSDINQEGDMIDRIMRKRKG